MTLPEHPSQSFMRRNPQLYGKLDSPSARVWTIEDHRAMVDYYTSTIPAEFRLEDLAAKLGRTTSFICRKAGEAGLTLRTRAASSKEKALFSETRKGRPTKGRADWSKQPHPRGMLGKHHTGEAKEKISLAGRGRRRSPESVMEMLKTKHANGSLNPHRHGVTWKGQWVEVGGSRFYARSSWEANYARYLEWLKSNGEVTSWEHEPETFWFEKIKRGVRSYLPDFRVVTRNGIEYHEVKGWMDARSKTKIKRMKKYHPSVTLVVIDSKRYRAIEKSVRNVIKDWI